MIRNSFTKAAIIGTIVAAAFTGASFAQDSALGGAWKIESARFNDGSASISVERTNTAANQNNAQFIVVDGGNVYLATGMTMSTAAKATDVAAAGGKLVLIGTHARRVDFCSFKCQYGMPEQKLTLRFDSVGGADELMGEMVAYNKK
jgi:hypothetical protein